MILCGELKEKDEVVLREANEEVSQKESSVSVLLIKVTKPHCFVQKIVKKKKKEFTVWSSFIPTQTKHKM